MSNVQIQNLEHQISITERPSDDGVLFYRIIRAIAIVTFHHLFSLKDEDGFVCFEQEQMSICRRVRLFRCSPQTAGGVAQQQGRLELDLVFVAVRDGAPARVRDDDRVCQCGQSVADNGHLHRITRRQVPQDALQIQRDILVDILKQQI